MKQSRKQPSGKTGIPSIKLKKYIVSVKHCFGDYSFTIQASPSNYVAEIEQYFRSNCRGGRIFSIQEM